MSLERWRGRSLSSSQLALTGRSAIDYQPIRRSLSASNLSLANDYYYDIIDRYRPWYSKFYSTRSPYGDISYSYNNFYYPYNYYRTRRLLESTPDYTYISFPRVRTSAWWYDLDDPYFYRRSYSSTYYDYPYRYWASPSYYESKLYDSLRPYNYYYPRSYYSYY